MTEDQQIEGLRRICAGVQLMQESGQVFAFLPQLRFQAAGQRIKMDALLAPHEHSGYSSRLFLESILPTYSGAWQGQHILGRDWSTISWQGVSSDQEWTKILAQHLRPFI